MPDALPAPDHPSVRSPRLGGWWAALFAAWAPVLGAAEAAAPHPGSLYLVLDNDVFVGADDGYTNGLTLGWLSGSGDSWARVPGFGWLSPLAELVPLVNGPGRLHAVSVDLAHLMYTPEDLTRDQPDPNDRPYVGMSYLSIGLHQFDHEHLDSWKLIGGLVGDSSYAEEAQIWTHELIGSDRPEGWDHQIPSSAVASLSYEHRWRWLQIGDIEGGFGSDAIMGGSAILGNLRTSLSTELNWRIGYRVATGFGAVGSQPHHMARLIPGSTGSRWGMHLNLGIGGEAVGYDVTLDGRLFSSDDLRIEREPLVARAFVGLGAHLKRLRIHLQLSTSSRTYKEEIDRSPSYGRLLVGWDF